MPLLLRRAGSVYPWVSESGKGHFDLQTLYNFQQRLARRMAETGENLLEGAFE